MITSDYYFSMLIKVQNNYIEHHLKRYCEFVQKCCILNSQKTKQELGYTEKHHILPQIFFPEYKSFAKFPWNKAVLTFRQHILCHYMLMKSYPDNISMACAFNRMVNSSQDRLTGVNTKLLEKSKQEFSRAISKVQSGRTVSEVTKSRISMANSGRIHTDETKAKIAVTSRGRFVSAETRNKISKIHKGKIVSEEIRLNMSNAQKGKGVGRKHSEETKEKIRKGNTGKKMSIESKEKSSKTRKMLFEQRRLSASNENFDVN